jgi:hypothetical protein
MDRTDRSWRIRLAGAEAAIPGPAREHAAGLLQRGARQVMLSDGVRGTYAKPYARGSNEER